MARRGIFGKKITDGEIAVKMKEVEAKNDKGQSCGTCPFCLKLDEIEGECHRFPPIVAGGEYSFPIVNLKEGWCGEHPLLRR